MKFLVDMNLSPAWVRVLTEAGFEAVHWTSVGPTNASDRAVMQWASEHRCIVLTCDLDFSALLAATQRREPSVVQIRSDRLAPSAIGSVILAAIRHSAVDLQAGALLSIDAARGRLRVLPLPGDPKFLLMIDKCGPIRRRLEVDELIGLDRLPPWL